MKDLGELRQSCRYRKGMGCTMVLLTLACLLIGGAMLLAMIFSFIEEGSAFADAAAGGCAGVLLMLIGGGLSWSTYLEYREKPEVHVHENGVRYVSRSLNIEGTWNEFDFLKITRRRRRGSSASDPGYQVAHLTTRGENRQTFEFDSGFYDGDPIAAIELLRSGTLRAFLPAYRRMLNNGQDIKLSGVVITKSHLHEGERSIPFRGVTSLRIDGTHLVLRMRDGAEHALHVHGKANAHVMIALIEERIDPEPTPVAAL